MIHIGFQIKTTLNRGWVRGLLFHFRGDRSRAQKLENIWKCLNSLSGVVGQYGSTPIRRTHTGMYEIA